MTACGAFVIPSHEWNDNAESTTLNLTERPSQSALLAERLLLMDDGH